MTATEQTEQGLDFGGYVVRVPGPVLGKQRARTGNGRTYTPAKTVERERAIRLAAQNQHPEVQHHDDGAYEWAMTLTFRRTNRAHASDLDNMAKAVMDALNGWAYKDDRQVTRLDVAVKTNPDYEPLTLIHLYPHRPR